MPGVRVDGNDLIAVNEVMQEVYDFVREGNGPVLVGMVLIFLFQLQVL